jgi:hypothetical protein
MSSGGLLQLIAKGVQDTFLIDNTENQFLYSYDKSSNYALETVKLSTISGIPNFGNTIECTIPRLGDLLNNVYIRVKLPELNIEDLIGWNQDSHRISWTKFVGQVLIKNIKLLIGNQEIISMSSHMQNIYSDFTDDGDCKIAMVGKVPSLNSPIGGDPSEPDTVLKIEEDILYIPTLFWFSDINNKKMTLPLLALQYSEVKLIIELNDFDKLYRISELSVDTNPNTGLDTDISYTYQEITSSLYIKKPKCNLDISLVADYIYLEKEHRQKIASENIDILILQFQEHRQNISGNGKVPINFNHPVKEVYWTLQKESNVKTNDHFNFTDTDTADPETSHIKSKNILENAKLIFNGIDRTPLLDYKYFGIVQNYQGRNNITVGLVYVYNFSVNPRSFIPEGSCNFSRLSDPYLYIELKESVKADINNDSITIVVYAVNYNILRIRSGMAGIAFYS